MPGLVLAWLTGEGIIFYRSWKQDQRFPVPGQLLAASGVFVLLAFLAQAPRAQFLASALAWGFDVAALLNVLPDAVTGGTSSSATGLFGKSGPVEGSGEGARKAGGGSAG